MSHMPVDHPLRGFYRGLTVLTGVVSAGWGAVALASTSDHSFTDVHGEHVLGMKGNGALALVFVVIGIIAILTSIVGRNVDARVNYIVGPALWVVGTIGLILIRTPDNYLAFSITSVIALYVIGSLLLCSALYVRSSGAAQVRRPSAERTTIGASH